MTDSIQIYTQAMYGHYLSQVGKTTIFHQEGLNMPLKM